MKDDKKEAFGKKQIATISAVFVLGAIAPFVYEYWVIRAKIDEVMTISTSGIRVAVTETAQATGTLAKSGANLVASLPPDFNIKLTVSESGVITFVGFAESNSVGANVTMTQTPTLSDGKVSWSCVGRPAKYFPKNCW